MGIISKLFGKTNSAQNNGLSVVNDKMPAGSPLLSVHQDFKKYIWIGDGKYKNYVPSQKGYSTVLENGYRLTITFSFEEEPSLIYTKLPIAFDGVNVDTPPYYPSYKNLSPEQKGVYWRFLANPYDPSVDIGYVFILYYGLERFLMTNKYEEIIDLIIRLRDTHTNKSFQSYTANAIILTCLHYQRPDLVQKFMNSLDKNHEVEFSNDLFLLCKHELNLPLSPEDIMRMAKSFGFKKNTYIKQYPDLFLAELSNVLINKYGSDSVLCTKLITDKEFNSLPKCNIRVFANISIKDDSVAIPTMTAGTDFSQNIYTLLDCTHEAVKKQLAEMRKEGIATPKVEKPAPNKEKKINIFDSNKEAELLEIYKHSPDNSLAQHFASIELQQFYYKYRDLGQEYIDKCIYYCLDDISRLPEIQAAYRKDIRNMTRGAFDGRIPAYERLAIIYEKQKELDKAIDICDKASQYYGALGMIDLREDFVARRLKILDKKNKRD